MNTDKHKSRKTKDRSRVHPHPGEHGGAYDLDNTEEKQNNKNNFSKFQETVKKGVMEKNAISLITNMKKGGAKWLSYSTMRRKTHFDGEVRISRKCTGGLGLEYDSNKVDEDETDHSLNSTRHQLVKAHNRNLIEYFARLGQSRNMDDCVNLEYVESLFLSGASVNCTDKYGQTILHEVARAWHTDVARFLVEKGAKVDQADFYGRTPLHVAAAVDYPEMVKLLIELGANKESCTKDENQTPVHFAARNDACESLKALIEKGCDYKSALDYKGRTPLHVAAELDRSETARLLLELDDPASVGTTDNFGESVLVLMISKMPPVAKLGLDQLHTTDRANRRQHYHLQHLEPKKPDDQRPGYPQTALRVCVRQSRYDLIQHSVFLCLIGIKWKKFGRCSAIIGVIINLVFNILWSVQGILVEYDQRHIYVLPKEWWRIFVFILAILLTVYQIVEEIYEYHNSKKAHKLWRDWRESEIQKDKVFAHPRWPEELAYLEQEDGDLDKLRPQYFNDFWNIYDWICYTFLVVVVLTHLIDVFHHTNFVARLHIRLMAVTIILLWLRLMKSARAFSLLGPFIVMVSHMLQDVVKFVFLYMVFYIPYACAFWMIFGENKVPEEYQGLPGSSNYTVSVDGLSTPDALLFTLFRMTLVDDYDYDGMKNVDSIMAYVLIGSWLAISAVLMLNMLIALLSDTFQRVHDNAKANALMQKAIFILNVEEGMNQKKKDKFRAYIHGSCSPLTQFYDDDTSGSDGGDELRKVTFQIKDQLENLTNQLKSPDHDWQANLNEDDDDGGGDDNHGGGKWNPEQYLHGGALHRKTVSTKKFEQEMNILHSNIKSIKRQQQLMINSFKNEMALIKNALQELLNKPISSQESMLQMGTAYKQGAASAVATAELAPPLQTSYIQPARSTLLRSSSLILQHRQTVPVSQDPEWIQSEQRRKEELETLKRQLHEHAESSYQFSRVASRPSLTPLNTAEPDADDAGTTRC